MRAARHRLEARDGVAAAAPRKDELTLLLTAVYAFLIDYYDFVLASILVSEYDLWRVHFSKQPLAIVSALSDK